MKDDEIVTLGKNADAYANNQTSDSFDWKLIRDARFAELVAAAEREAHASLIAAAPELLDALRGLLALEEENLRGYDDIDVCAEVQFARFAIAKATGCADSGDGSQKVTP